jgi:hypothetical protein
VSVSPQIRILALAGLLLALVGGGFSLYLSRSVPPDSGGVVVRRHAPTTQTATTSRPTTTASAHAAAGAAATGHVTTTAAAKAAATHKATATAKHPSTTRAKQARPAARGYLVDARLPAPLQWQLSQHRIVVVALYNPGSDVDAISVAEAHAGATDAGVGFLLVSVLDNAVAGPLTALLPGGGLLPNPGILVYRAPGRLVYRFDGFLDRASIAQAAVNAKAGQVDPSVSDPTLSAAAPTATTP